MTNKARKLRGSHTHGYGSKKKHRGKGNKGGKGLAGSSKHKFTYVVKFNASHFTHPKLKPKKKGKSINVSMLGKFMNDEKTIDLKKLGFSKIIGAGNVPELKGYKIIVDSCSQKAKEKLENAGVELSQ